MELTLTDEQRTLLVSILADELGEVREEVYKAEIQEYRDQLRIKEGLIREIMARLGAQPGT